MINNVVGGIVITLTNFSIWSKILDKKLNYKDRRLYIGIIALAFFIVISSFLSNKILSIIIAVSLYVIMSMFVFRISLKMAVLLAALTQLLYILSESIIIFLAVVLLNIKDQNDLVSVFFGTIHANIFISLLTLIVGHFKFTKNVYNKIIYISEKERFIKIATTVIVFILTSSLLFYCMYYRNSLTIFLAICTMLTIAYFIIIIRAMLIKNNYLNMYVKYNDSIQMLKSYENILDRYKVSNHENKNQLLAIRNMVIKNEPNVTKFIDNLVKNEYKDDEKLMMETSKIPSGGLRALIYSKLLYMKNNDIDFILKVDRKIRSVQLIDLDPCMVLDICKIVGVFLDNAIEEANKTKKGCVSVEIFILDEQLNISIGNNFEGIIDLDKIDETRYTTKGEGHGYGLALVKEIINKNTKLKNIRMINDNVFIQILKIDI